MYMREICFHLKKVFNYQTNSTSEEKSSMKQHVSLTNVLHGFC